MFINPYLVIAGATFLVSCVSAVMMFVDVRREAKRGGRYTK
ncbi:hypothetical protein [Wenjunlia tyrosinilytica]|nr:hypothetical protein [Wenjunlia tyrosinilytica]